MVTLQDIADRVGVTRTVVSYVLANRLGKIRVSEARRTEILRVAAEMKYVPNRSARTLITRRNHAMGLLLHREKEQVPDAGHYALLFNLLEGMRSASARVGYQSLYDTANLTDENAFEPPAYLSARTVDAVALYGYVHPATARSIVAMGLPCLHIGTNLDPAVGIPNVAAGMDVAIGDVAAQAAARGVLSAHLFLPGGPGPEGIAQAFLSRASADFPQMEASVTLGSSINMSYEAIVQHGRELGARERPPALLFCSLSAHAPLLAGLRERGLRCPEDIQLVGIASEGHHGERLADRGELISQIVLPFTHIGEIIAQQFVELLEGKRAHLEETIVPCSIVPGSTTSFLQL